MPQTGTLALVSLATPVTNLTAHALTFQHLQMPPNLPIHRMDLSRLLWMLRNVLSSIPTFTSSMEAATVENSQGSDFSEMTVLFNA